jgi:hypothetical protein
VTISVNAETGRVNSYFRNWGSNLFMQIEDVSEAITPEVALQRFNEQVELRLRYNSRWEIDPESGEFGREIFLEYAYYEISTQFIDAMTGLLYNPPQYDPWAIGMGRAPMASAMGGDFGGAAEDALEYQFTEAELAHLELIEGFISSDDAIAILLAIPFIAFDNELIISSASYSRDWRENNTLNLSFSDREQNRWVYATLDAISGELFSFSSHNNDDWRRVGLREVISEELYLAHAKNAEAFVAAVRPQLLNETSMDLDYERDVLNSFWSWGTPYRFIRQVNGIPFFQNSIEIVINPDSGRVTNFWVNWEDDLIFPSPEGIITPEAALAILNAAADFNLSYLGILHVIDEELGEAQTLVFDAKLIYNVSTHIWLSVDANSGTLLRFGSEFDPNLGNQEVTISFTDLDGDRDADRIIRLMEFLRFDLGEEFLPEQQMTQAEYLAWLLTLSRFYTYPIPLETIYSEMRFTQSWDEELNDPDLLLTRMHGVEYLVRLLGLQTYAEMEGIFINPLNLSPRDAAYAALAMGLRAINIAQFEPQAELTRREAALMLYRFLDRP